MRMKSIETNNGMKDTYTDLNIKKESVRKTKNTLTYKELSKARLPNKKVAPRNVEREEAMGTRLKLPRTKHQIK